MNELPKISIVTPSFNQGAYLAETLRSLVDQDYPNLEVVIQEGGSTDQSIEIAQEFVGKHPQIFRLFVEADQGQADALNRGFAKTSGEILGFLNSDDLLLPGCLHRVAQEIDPGRGRCVVFGRSVFFGSDPAKEGKDHPFEYTSHFEQLAIWKRRYNRIPQPSTFWHRSVWERCGPVDPTISHALDYDLFCRFSQQYRFHKVPERWSRFRLHSESKTVNKTRDQLIEECIEISRRHWGSWWTPLRWRCEISHGLYRRSRRPQAVKAVRKAETAALEASPLKAFLLSLASAWKAPLALGPRILFPLAATRGWNRLARWLQAEPPEDLCPNQWIGPFYETRLPVLDNDHSLQIEIEIPERFSSRNFQVRVTVEGTPYSNWQKTGDSVWSMEIPLTDNPHTTVHAIFSSNRYFVPQHSGENEDTRFLSCRLRSLLTRPTPTDHASEAATGGL